MLTLESCCQPRELNLPLFGDRKLHMGYWDGQNPSCLFVTQFGANSVIAGCNAQSSYTKTESSHACVLIPAFNFCLITVLLKQAGKPISGVVELRDYRCVLVIKKLLESAKYFKFRSLTTATALEAPLLPLSNVRFHCVNARAKHSLCFTLLIVNSF